MSACAVAQVPNFKQVKNIDLSTAITAGSDYGDLACDVTTDGTNLYVSGLKNSAGTGKSGVATISDPLGTPSVAKLFSTGDVAGLVAAGGGRESKVEYMVDGSGNAELFFGYGLSEVHPAGTPDWKNSAFVRWNFPTNQRDGLWAQLGFTADPADTTPGYLTPAEVNGSTANRMNGLALDPFTSTPRLAVSAYGRGLLFRFLDGNGANAGNATNSNNFLSARNWRDICFDAAGNLFWRSLNDVWYAPRTGASAFGAHVKLVDLADVDTQMQNVWYIPAASGCGATILATDHNDGANYVIKVYQESAGVWSQVGSINGTEPISGVAQNGFTTDVLGFRTAVVGGKLHLLVAYGENGVNNKNAVRMYEVSGGSTFSGVVSLSGYAGNLSSEVMTAKIKDGSGTLLETLSFSPDNAGNFSLTTTAATPYTVVIKADTSLTRKIVNVSGGSIGNVNLLNGNVDTTDVVDIADYTVLAYFFDRTSGDPDWLTVDNTVGFAPADADFNGDGFIDIADYTILASNFDASGEE
ncbi:MAG: hypothetical protein JNJ45_12330 [Chthonomonas sp.]|nr:hypothetical protein [Chthonomonas sp.]